ncbi:hypothetical protein B0J13DRAFT_579397 [Dactylonectria estremocensis]|uniref:Uncharacterized protein n=1 Tax=Dactylonectria estremocensis TaxID=1079267 RepID=A0A9P9I5V4_9HYPO|nr:hypothetical protein B0J13DRAFT_579397 [Dactylonectria estremocensis]
MSVKQLEAVAHFILALCERAKSDGPESIDDDAIVEVLTDFSYEAITPEARHGWKDAIVAIANLSKLFNSTATYHPPSNVSTATASTVVTTTAPTAITSTTTPTSNVSTATASTAVASTTTTATTAPTLIPPKNTPEKKHSRKRKEIAVSKEISENLETWKHSPEKLFHQDSIPLQGSLCDYINKVSNSDILNTLRLRFAKRMLFQKRSLWTRKATNRFFQHLKDRGAAIEKKRFNTWIYEGDTYDLFVQTWGNGSLLATDLAATQAAKFPHKKDESRNSRLATEASRGIKNLADKYNDTGAALWSYFSQIPFTDNFVPEDTTSLKRNRKRRPSQTLPHQDRRLFRIDATPAEFAQQPELVSYPVTTQLGHVAEREAASTDGITTRDARGWKGSRLEVENLQCSSPTAPARHQPVAEPSLRSASSSPDRGFTEDDCQRPLNCGTDMSTYSGHRNDRLVVRPSPRTHQRVFGAQDLSPSSSDSQQRPVEMSEDPMRNARLISGTVRATSPVFSPSHLIDHQLSHGTRDVLQHPHSMPTTTAIQNRIAERPASNPRSGPQHDRQLELSPSQQPKLPSPEPREEAKTNDGGLGSTPSCPQYGNSPPHPPQTVPDPTVIQRYGNSIQEAPSSQQLLESPETGLPHQPSPSPPSNVIMVGRVPAASTSIPQAVPAQQDHSSPRTRLPTPMTAEVTGPSTATRCLSAPPSSLQAAPIQQQQQFTHSSFNRTSLDDPREPLDHRADNGPDSHDLTPLLPSNARTSSAPSLAQSPKHSVLEIDTSTQGPQPLVGGPLPDELGMLEFLSGNTGAIQTDDSLDVLDGLEPDDYLEMAFPNHDADTQEGSVSLCILGCLSPSEQNSMGFDY